MAKINRYPVVISFRVTKACSARLEDVAGTMSKGAYARKVVLKEVGRSHKTPRVQKNVRHAEHLSKLYIELVRQGSNMNQAVRRLNSGAEQSGLKLLAETRDAHTAVLQALAKALGGTSAP